MTPTCKIHRAADRHLCAVTCRTTVERLRSILKQLEEKDVDFEEIKKNLDFTASLLEAVYHDGSRQCLESEDDLQQLQSDGVPTEVTDWLASTFTQRVRRPVRRSDEKPKFRSIVHAVQAGIFVERMFKRAYTAAMPDQPAAAVNCLRDVDRWNFDVFALNSASSDHALQTLFFELITRYGLNSRFKIPISCLTGFLSALERGYCKHNNPYHSHIHAADVTQTLHCLLLRSGLVHWLTELEVMASLFAAAIHDYEHTGTTNNFHIHTKSEFALIYNDRSVQESHHLSAAFRLLQDDQMNIFTNLTREEWMLRKFNMDSRILCNFYRCTIESILTGCITAWYGSCTALNRKTLQRVVKTAQHITRTELPSMEDLYTQRCRKKAGRILKDPHHPSNNLFCLLPSGRRYRSIRTKTTRLRDSFIPQTIRLLNS
ncbi:dual specificity calcium/calmodulin-dependent 3',5'-cyclic nucleotide phosphodiesterase 1B-like isoform X3 [Eleginops maclovinus]|uniref:dual specificity calcium/calmodulin-dependent 3',5'-cyclic nucleotide phosphodiesterase 1B-like isoform X3 n=1 Tax=Eleginops maclovinus TaxID=56733 RepID=UPI003080A889